MNHIFSTWRAGLIALVAFVAPIVAYGQSSAAAKVEQALNAFISSKDFKVSGLDYVSADGGKTITGAIDMWGQTAVKLIASTTGADTAIRSIQLEFPAASSMNIGKLSAATGGQLTQYLPTGFPMSAGVNIQSVSITLEGKRVSECAATFATASDWSILGAGPFVLKQVVTTFRVANPTTAERQLSGTIAADATLASSTLSLQTELSPNKNDIAFSGTISNVGLGQILSGMMGDASNDLHARIPQFVKDLRLDQTTVTVWPFAKRASCVSTTSWGDMEANIQGMGTSGKYRASVAVAPPSSFRFSEISSSLSAFDQMDFTGTALIITTQSGEMTSGLSAFKADGGVVNVISGINFITQVQMGPDMEKIVKTKSLNMRGAVGSDMKTARMECALEFADLGSKDVQFKEVAFGLEVGVGKLDLFLKGRLEVVLDGDRITFNTELRGSPIDLDIQGSLYLQALQKAQQAVQEATVDSKPYWEEPFGVPYVAISRLGGGLGVSPKSPIVLSSIGLTGDVRLGSVGDKARHIAGNMDVSVDIADPMSSLLEVDVSNLTLLKVINAFSDASISGALASALDWGYDEGHVYLVPKDQDFMGKHYKQGISIGGKAKIAGISAGCDFHASTSGIGMSGTMDGMNYKAGDLTLFSLSGANGQGNPSFKVNLDASNPSIKVDGDITVLGITSTSFIDISKTGFTFNTTGKLFGGGLSANLTVSAPDFANFSGFYVKAEMVNTIQQQVHDAIVGFIEREHQKNAQALRDAKNSLANSKGSNVFEEAALDVAEGVVSVVGELEHYAAVVGKYIADGLLQEAISIKRISFEGGLNGMNTTVGMRFQMTIAGQDIDETIQISINVSSVTDFLNQVTSQLADVIEGAFGQLANTVTDGFESFVQEAEVFFEGVGEGFVLMGAGIMEGVNYIGEQLNINFNREGDYQALAGPSNGSRPAKMPPGVTRFGVSVASIQCLSCQDAVLYPACEFYGNVVISTNVASSQNPGSNQYLYKGSHSDIDPNDFLSQGGPTKDLYITDEKLAQAYVTVVADFWEDDDGWDDEQVMASNRFFVGDIAPGGRKGSDVLYLTAGASSNRLLIRFTITRDAKPEPAQMVAAARAGLSTELAALAKNGGNVMSPGIMQAAIESKNLSTVDYLHREGNRFTAADLSLALQPQNLNMDVGRYILSAGVYPQNEHMDQAVAQKNVALVNLLLDHKAGASVAHVQQALSNNDRASAIALMRSPVAVPSNVTQIAIDRNDMELVSRFVSSGSQFTRDQLNRAVAANNVALVRELAKAVPPDHASLQQAAVARNRELFALLGSAGARLTDNQPLNVAVSNDDFDIFKLAFDYGADASLALQTAANTNKPINWINECLNRKGNPDMAIDYAVRNKQAPLVGDLLSRGASPELLLQSCVRHNDVAHAKIALDGGATPGAHVAAAALLADPGILKMLVTAGGNPNDGMKASVDNNRVDAVKFLLDNGAGAMESAYVLSAVKQKSQPMTQLLCDFGADPNAGITHAVGDGTEPIVKTLLDYGASPVRQVAVPTQKDQLSLVKLLLDYGGDPNEGIAIAVSNNKTPMTSLLLDYNASPAGQLKVAAPNNNLDIVKRLLTAGADANEGMTGAMDVNNTEMVRVLLDHGAGAGGYMHVPAGKGNLDIVTMLVDAGASPDEGLRAGVDADKNAIVDYLLAEGAQVKQGMLVPPSGRGNLAMVKSLVVAGAVPDEGMKPGVDNGRDQVVGYLISEGANGSRLEYMLTTVRSNFSKLVPILVAAGNNKDYVDPNKNGFLHMAAQSEFTETVIELVKAGCDINAKNNEGNSVLHLAVRGGKDNLDMVQHLVEHGADINAVNNEGKTVTKYAKGSKVTKYLKDLGGSKKN